jgi:hypothetical protein
LGIALLLLCQAEVLGQCSSIIDLNAWAEQGPPANGTWNVNAPGTIVTQTINSYPTFFVSPQEFINVRITGTLQSTGSDDDFIGFAIGYRNPIGGVGSVFPVETWLFDWKRGTQTVGGYTVQMGQYLSQINGNFDLTIHGPEFWGHASQNGFNVVASNTGPGTAWAVNAVYNFELTYLSSRMVVAINGDTIFDVPGCYEPGRFGFYNYSQGPTVYSNFAYELIPDFTMTTFSVCLGDSSEFQYISDTCSSSLLTNSVVASWRWDFGDGDTSALASPAHLYDTLGTYNVTLVVTDNFGCRDSITLPTTVNICPLPVRFSYFEVRADGPAALLEWETFSESGNKGYEIWRSEDAQNYEQVGWVPAANGNTIDATSYRFRDRDVRSGPTYFYRLHQIDQNGQAHRTEVREFTLPPGIQAGMSAYPNPTSDVVRLRLALSEELSTDAEITLELLDIAGIRQEVKVTSTLTAHDLEVLVDLGALPVGIYLAKVWLGDLEMGVVKLLKK